MESPKKIAICTGADARYFNLLDNLIASLTRLTDRLNFTVCVFDLGLTIQHRQMIEALGALVLKPNWSFDFKGRANAPGWFAAMINRPFLPQHFPGFDTYVWLDADTWVHDPSCLLELINASNSGQIALSLEQFGPPRSYCMEQAAGSSNIFHLTEAGCRASVEHCYRTCFGVENSYRAGEAITNSGVFALRADSPVWGLWSDYLVRGVHRGMEQPPISFLVEQQALNLAYLEGKISVRVMPFRYNWVLNTNHPVIDLSRQMLVVPTDFNTPVGILHLNSLKELRSLDVKTPNGQIQSIPLEYKAFAKQFPKFLDH